MNILAALARAYQHLPDDRPPYEFSYNKISFCVVLSPDGSVTKVKDLRYRDKKRTPQEMLVPLEKKRTSGIAPNFLWGNTSYVLGVTADENKSDRTNKEHEAFRNYHLEKLANSEDEGLLALTRFLKNYTPDSFKPPLFSDEMLKKNFVFALSTEYRTKYLHNRNAAHEAWQSIADEDVSDTQICLVSGLSRPIARLHPRIKGVEGIEGAKPMDADIVSFNKDAFQSYGHKQGNNAPVSKIETFAYTTALNYFLKKDSGHSIQIGDTSTVFWAEAEDRDMADNATETFAGFMNHSVDEKNRTNTIRARLGDIRNGKRLSKVAPKLAEGVRFYILGLTRNAARLSVRFYWENDFGQLTENYQRYLQDTEIDPPPHNRWPQMKDYLCQLAILKKSKDLKKSKNVPPKLAGDWMRAILTGESYPKTLLSTALMRMRSDGQITSLRVAIIKSVLKRNLNLEVPVGLNESNTNKGYLLGRLFAVYENVQNAASENLQSTITDKFFRSASVTPQRVFHTLSSGSKNHFAKLKKHKPNLAINREKILMSITDLMEADGDPIPVYLSLAEQAMFSIGYYHQRSFFFRKHDDTEPNLTETSQ